jgi:hypothetical protein
MRGPQRRLLSVQRLVRGCHRGHHWCEPARASRARATACPNVAGWLSDPCRLRKPYTARYDSATTRRTHLHCAAARRFREPSMRGRFVGCSCGRVAPLPGGSAASKLTMCVGREAQTAASTASRRNASAITACAPVDSSKVRFSAERVKPTTWRPASTKSTHERQAERPGCPGDEDPHFFLRCHTGSPSPPTLTSALRPLPLWRRS